MPCTAPQDSLSPFCASPAVLLPTKPHAPQRTQNGSYGPPHCQSAFNRDPLSARKRDPLAEMVGG
jgi:hypothetical protein